MNLWKITAFVFIFLFLIETAFLSYLYSYGVKTKIKEDQCASLCLTKEADSYDYLPGKKNICTCFKNRQKIYEGVE